MSVWLPPSPMDRLIAQLSAAAGDVLGRLFNHLVGRLCMTSQNNCNQWVLPFWIAAINL
jgi:hypothetical protein